MWYVPLNVLLFCYMYMDVIGVPLFYAANTTLVCDLSDIKYVVFFVSILYLPGDGYLCDDAVDRRETLHDGRAESRTCLLPLWWRLGSLQKRNQKWYILGNLSSAYRHRFVSINKIHCPRMSGSCLWPAIRWQC